MDVDAPNLLKRCSSAPLINEVASTAATSPTTSTAPRNTSFFSMLYNNNRTRRYSSGSGSISPLTAPVNLSNNWGPRMTPRVNQLRAEESAEVRNTREVQHERELHSAMQMGQSCEDLSVSGLPNSPTRTPRFSPAVTPSPTRNNHKYTTRHGSVSPTITLRQSSFSPVSRPTFLIGKRPRDEADSPISKRMCTGTGTGRLTPSTPGTPDSDSLDCTFRPVSPRVQPINELQEQDRQDGLNLKTVSPS